MSFVRLEKDADGIVELIFDQQGKSVNVMGDEYMEAMPKILDELEAQKNSILGVYVRSGKPGQFFAGGFEIALAYYRIALNNKSVQIGLPEAMLGLMPGAGGVVRMVRLLGMQDALTLISQGKRLKAEPALEKGLIHDLADTEEEMAAKTWIKANLEAKQPWEEPGYTLPGGGPEDPAT